MFTLRLFGSVSLEGPSALGREAEVMEVIRTRTDAWGEIADELIAHGHPRPAISERRALEWIVRISDTLVASSDRVAAMEARARIAALSAGAQGHFDGGFAHRFHTDPLLAPLRGYPPFEALLKPDE